MKRMLGGCLILLTACTSNPYSNKMVAKRVEGAYGITLVATDGSWCSANDYQMDGIAMMRVSQADPGKEFGCNWHPPQRAEQEPSK